MTLTQHTQANPGISNQIIEKKKKKKEDMFSYLIEILISPSEHRIDFSQFVHTAANENRNLIWSYLFSR